MPGQQKKDKKNSTVALVLSGGGAKGAFQFGAIKYIEEVIKKENPGFDYSIIAGVSVGALNAAMLAMRKYSGLEGLWNSICNKQIYKSHSKIRSAFRVLFGRTAVMSNAPLAKLIETHIRLADFDPAYDVSFGAVSLNSGAYHAFTPRDFDDDTNLRNAVLASTAIPLIWPPVSAVRTANKLHYTHLVDGGIRNISPLGDVIDKEPSKIIIINCSNPDIEVQDDPAAAGSFFNIALRTLSDIMSNEIFLTDLREYITINHIVRQAAPKQIPKKNGSGFYRSFDTVLIQPDRDMGDTLDFSETVLRSRIAAGYAAAEKAFKEA